MFSQDDWQDVCERLYPWTLTAESPSDKSSKVDAETVEAIECTIVGSESFHTIATYRKSCSGKTCRATHRASLAIKMESKWIPRLSMTWKKVASIWSPASLDSPCSTSKWHSVDSCGVTLPRDRKLCQRNTMNTSWRRWQTYPPATVPELPHDCSGRICLGLPSTFFPFEIQPCSPPFPSSWQSDSTLIWSPFWNPPEVAPGLWTS